MPNKIVYHKFDTELYLNLNNKIHVEILKKELHKVQDKIIFSKIKENIENKYLEEYVCFARKKKIINLSTKINKYYESVNYMFGEQWVYIKFYGINDRIEEFLKYKLLDFIKKIKLGNSDCLFHYLIYDDGVKHIRFRIKFKGVKNFYEDLENFIKDIKKEGYVNRVVLDTYYPEIQKYGNVNIMKEVHKLFCEDSLKTLIKLKNGENKYLSIIRYVIETFLYVEYDYYGICNIIFGNVKVNKLYKEKYMIFKQNNV